MARTSGKEIMDRMNSLGESLQSSGMDDFKVWASTSRQEFPGTIRLAWSGHPTAKETADIFDEHGDTVAGDIIRANIEEFVNGGNRAPGGAQLETIVDNAVRDYKFRKKR